MDLIVDPVLLYLTTRELVFGFDFNVMIMYSMGFDATAPFVTTILFLPLLVLFC